MTRSGPGGFVARCVHCHLEVEVDTQRALDDVIKRFDGAGDCPDGPIDGHELEQEAPDPYPQGRNR